MKYYIEIRDTSDNLISRLENAYDIHYVEQINAPFILDFKLPAWDDKAANITLANEYWLIEDDEAGTQTTRHKFKLQGELDFGDESTIEIHVSCLDYLSQLTTGVVLDYTAGLVMGYVAQSADYGTTVQAIAGDSTHLYVAAGNFFYKILKSDMSAVATSPDYGDTIYAIAVDDTHVYVGGRVTNRVRKYLKSDLSYVAQAADYGESIYWIILDNTYVYAGGNSLGAFYIKKYLKSDMSTSATSPDVGGTMRSAAKNDTYIFVGCNAAGPAYTVRKYNVSDLTYTGVESPDYGGSIHCLAMDDTHVFVGGATTKKIRGYLITDLTLDIESPDYGGDIYAVIYQGSYVYAAGPTTQKVRRYLAYDLSYSDESPSYGGEIYAELYIDDTHIYAGGATTQRARKYSLSDTVEEIIDALLAFPMQTPAVTKGTIESAYGDLIRNISADGQSILEVLLSLQEMVGGYLEVDNNRQLNWLTAPTGAEDKGQQIRYKKNLLGIEREVDYTWLKNRIYPYGRDEAGLRVQLSDIQADDYVEDAASQAAWGGVYVGTFVNFSILSAASLLEWGNNLLDQHKNPLISYKIDSVNLAVDPLFSFDELHLGSTVTVIDERFGINISTEIVRIEYPDLLNPLNIEIEIANAVRNVSDTIAKLSSTQKRHDLLIAG